MLLPTLEPIIEEAYKTSIVYPQTIPYLAEHGFPLGEPGYNLDRLTHKLFHDYLKRRRTRASKEAYKAAGDYIPRDHADNEIVERVRKELGCRCAFCSIEINITLETAYDDWRITFDMYPERGGSVSLDNQVLICGACLRRRKKKTVAEFRERYGYELPDSSQE